MNPKTERFEMRLDPETIEGLDTWRSCQPDLPSRAEAVRRLIENGLTPTEKRPLRISDGEKMILAMVCELYDHLKIDSEIETSFVQGALNGGHYWSLEWKYPGIFHGHEDDPGVVSEVVQILNMWSIIERSYEKLPPKARDRVEKEAEPFGENVAFRGFDGNNESEHLGIARFLITKMDRFSEFKNRDLNSHSPGIGSYRRMLKAFEPINNSLSVEFYLSAEQIIEILIARRYGS